MKYKNGAAFRRALEDRLRAQSLQSGTPLVRIRKIVAFDRFLARLIIDQPGQWILKGGFALQLRIGARARTTKDIDLLSLNGPENLTLMLSMAGRADLGDWFEFEAENQPLPLPEGGHGMRYPVLSRLDGRQFETFHVDIGIGDPVSSPPDVLKTPPILTFADIPPTPVPCYPLTQHLAEKLHAYTRPYADGDNSRVKDLVDILLIAQENNIERYQLLQAIQETFSARQTHSLPSGLPEPPSSWVLPYRRLAADVGLSETDLREGYLAASHFINPVVTGQSIGEWNPEQQIWGHKE